MNLVSTSCAALPNCLSLVAQTFAGLTNQLHAYVIGFNIGLPIPDAESDICKLGVTCPMVAGTRYLETVHLPIPLDWPSVSLNLNRYCRFLFSLFQFQNAALRWKLVDPIGFPAACIKITTVSII